MTQQRTISLKLQPTPEQSQALSALQAEFAAGCNAVMPFVRENRCWNRVALHHLAYYSVRERSRLGSQMVCNAIKAVADAYKVLKLGKRDEVPEIRFRETGAVHFDARTYRLIGDRVSLYTLEGRIVVKMAPGDFQAQYIASGKPKEAKLVRKGKGWFFNLVLDLPDATPVVDGGVLGVDLGENNLAATSSGKLFGGGLLRNHRDRFLALRSRLQANGSESARQHLRKASGREARHVTHVNHEVSAAIVREALEVGASTIVLEDLTNIRKRIKAGLRMRTRLHRWAWHELQTFMEYKASAAGLRVIYVNPAYSSQTCSVCGCLGSRRNHRFSCSTCGSLAHADVNAASNLAKLVASAEAPRAEVTRPDVAPSVVTISSA